MRKIKKPIVNLINGELIAQKIMVKVLSIKRKKFFENGVKYDYQLENGIYLLEDNWNNEAKLYCQGYLKNKDLIINKHYRPIMRCDINHNNLSSLKVNSKDWKFATEIIAFEEY